MYAARRRWIVIKACLTVFGTLVAVSPAVAQFDFGTPVVLGDAVNNPTQADFGASVTEDGLLLFFSSEVPGSRQDLFYSTRMSTSEPWGPRQEISELNTSSWDAFPDISPDGSILYFSRGGTTTDGDGSDLWAAPIIPEPSSMTVAVLGAIGLLSWRRRLR